VGDDASVSIAVIAVVAGEPLDRLERLGEALARQSGVVVDVVVAAPPADRADIEAAFRPRGAIASLVHVDNPTGTRSPGLNRALEAVHARFVCRVDARSLPDSEYVGRCVSRLEAQPAIGIVGGHQRPMSLSPRVVARALARVLADPIAAGGAAYRRPTASGAVDTVYLGAFRTEELRAIGGWDERLAANEDFELSDRYRAGGQTVWLEEGIDVGYECRDRLSSVWNQYQAFGTAKVTYWRVTKSRPRLRQVVGVGLPIGLALAVVPAVWLAGWWPPALAFGSLCAIELLRPRTATLRVRVFSALLTPMPSLAFALGVCRASVSRARPRR
jgi:hypothetical protein